MLPGLLGVFFFNVEREENGEEKFRQQKLMTQTVFLAKYTMSV